MSDRAQRLLYLIPLALAIGIVAPFLGKAYTIDDTLFLMQAQQALVDPLHPTAFDVIWSDNKLVRCSAIMPSGPVQAFLLIPAVLASGSEIVAHAVQLVTLLLGIAGTMALGRSAGLSRGAAAFAGTVVAVSPCALGMSGTAMPDVPAMALGVWALYFAHRWKRRRSVLSVVAMVLLLALAALARPHAMGFVGIVFLLLAVDQPEASWLRRFQWRIRDVLPLVTAAGLVVAYGKLSADPVGGGGNLAGATRSLATLVEPDRHFIAYLAHWALTTPYPFLLLLLRRGRIRWAFIACLGLPFAAMVAGLGFFKQTWVGVLCAFSLAALVETWTTPRLEERPLHVALSTALLMPLGLMIYVHLPAKYLVTSLPAAGILLGAELDAQLQKSARPRVLVAALLAICAYFAFVGILILKSDSAYGDLTRRAAKTLVGDNVRAGRRVWVAGHWGFQWYATQEGGTVLSIDSHPAPRDLLVTPSKNHDGAYLPDRFPKRSKVDRLYDNESLIHATHHAIEGRGLGAGFYSNWWGLLPVVVGRAEMEQWELWQFNYEEIDP